MYEGWVRTVRPVIAQLRRSTPVRRRSTRVVVRTLAAALVCTAAFAAVGATHATAADGRPARPWLVPSSVGLVGDSITWANIPAQRSALEDVGVAVRAIDASPGRSLRTGWLCPSPTFVSWTPAPYDPRCAEEGLGVLRRWADAGSLGDAVVISLGTNDANLFDAVTHRAHLDLARRIVGDRPLYLVTATARYSEQRTKYRRYNDTARDWCRRDGRCVVIEWAATPAANDPDNYVDSVHLGPVGTRLRANFVAQQVRALAVTFDPAPSADLALADTPLGLAPMTPVRLVDTRTGVPGSSTGRLVPGVPRRVRVAGRPGVPAGAAAAAVTVTVTGGEPDGTVRLGPCGGRSLVAVGWTNRGATVSGGHVTALDANGALCLTADVSVHAVVDVSGVFAPGDDVTLRHTPLAPIRVVDSRSPTAPAAAPAPIVGSIIRVAGRGGVPADARAAVVTVTVIGPKAAANVVVHACGAVPRTTTLHVARGRSRSATTITELDGTGRLCVRSTAPAHVVVDVLGWFGPGATHSLQLVDGGPAVVLDTTSGGIDLSAGHLTRRPARDTWTSVGLAGVRALPDDVAGAVVGVSASAVSAGGYVAAAPLRAKAANVTSLMSLRGTAVSANGASSAIVGGRLGVYTATAAHLRVDLVAVWR
jgi:hypothetical protein